MRWILLGGAISGLLIVQMNVDRAPQAAPWCSHTEGATNCGFYDYRQCADNISGLGGYCDRNPRVERARHSRRSYRYADRADHPSRWRTVRRQDGWSIQRHSRTGEVRAVTTVGFGRRVVYRLRGGVWVRADG